MVDDWFANIKVVITNNREKFDLDIINKNYKISKLFILLLSLQLSFNISNKDDNQKNNKNKKSY